MIKTNNRGRVGKRQGIPTVSSVLTIPSIRRVARWLADRQRACADWVMRSDDAVARRNGWQIRPARVGLARLYRDPRFDNLHCCPACSGPGSISPLGSGPGTALPCIACAATGRIVAGNGQARTQAGGGHA